MIGPDGARVEEHADERYGSDAALLEWGSITKSVTAAGVLRAASEGLLELDAEVRSFVPAWTRATYTVDQVLQHRSGLLRVPLAMLLRRSVDPYRSVRGKPLPTAWTRPLGDRGEHLYSNTGYAVLGAVLDVVTGSWWDWCRAQVLVPAGISSATLDPGSRDRLVGARHGKKREPWSLGAGPFSAAGGVWSTFDDLARFASWSFRQPDCPPSWTRRDGVDFVNGATRDAHACIVRAVDRHTTVVVHSLGLGAGTDRLAVDLLRGALHGR